MSPTLQEEIRQSRPFDSLQQEVLLNLARTAAMLMHRMEQHFREFGPRLLKRTETAGLIRRAADPDDKRVLSVRLTPQGARLLQEIAPRIAQLGETLFPNLTKQQLGTLNELLNASREPAP
jgi:hypothetical protein